MRSNDKDRPRWPRPGRQAEIEAAEHARRSRQAWDDDEDEDDDDIDEEEEERQIQAARERCFRQRRIARDKEEQDEEEEEDIPARRSKLPLPSIASYDDDGEISDPVVELLECYGNLLFWQEKVADYRSKLATLLQQHPALMQRWAEFQRLGGLTSKDLEDFLNGKMRPKIVRKRSHLRLATSRKPPVIKLRHPDSDDAA